MTFSKSFYTSSRGIVKQTDLSVFLDADIHSLSDFKSANNSTKEQAVVGWGNKANTQKSVEFAQNNNLPFYRLEDAFLGYFGHPSKRNIRVGLIKDSQGIYYDAFNHCDLEDFIQLPLSADESSQSIKDLALFKELRLSKYNDPTITSTATTSTATSAAIPATTSSDVDQTDDYVLLIDQTFADQSITSGGANQDCFLWMLLDALYLYPNSKIIIRTHPDVKAGKKTGCFKADWLKLSDRIELNDKPINAIDLIEPALAVFCVTSQMGFESILQNKKVFTYSTAFYTGLGLTQDRIHFLSHLSAAAQIQYFDDIGFNYSTNNSLINISQFEGLFECHQTKRNIRLSDYWLSLDLVAKKTALFYAAMIRYPTYVHPDTQTICSLNELLNWFKVQQHFKLETQHPIVLFGFSLWKKWFIPAYIPFKHRHNLIFVSTHNALQKQLKTGCDVVITWGAVRAESVSKLLEHQTLYCVEDGFIRSQGLGVDLKRPSSLCFDDLSIYYNSLKPSRLNSILQNSKPLIDTNKQVRYLINAINSNGLSKYNVGQPLDCEIESAINRAKGESKEIILIPGQVMGDASLKYGTGVIDSNIKLIKQVKQDYPDAFIIYKPHPDVFASKKGDFTELSVAYKNCSLVLNQQDIALLYPHIGRLCTMTSLSGFEALLRGIKVDCYGKPFYSGWGLTLDHHTISDRTNTLSIEQLVAATLITYPLYVNWRTWTFMQPEVLVHQISGAHVKIKPTGFFAKMHKKMGYLIELYQMSRKTY
ncbi:MAG: capsular polysaccharide biosynthesis protein [Saccharospirillaceae bacterium]|nr:hypothetical protein [Pseudomonadales bacterium]NRB79817.1 capsular polysaccharide biosynthesis protein [Saccharospirillaceae bacterium]